MRTPPPGTPLCVCVYFTSWMRIAGIKTIVQLRDFGQDNSEVFSKSNISCNASRIWKRLLDCLHSRILLITFSVLIGSSFLDGVVSMGKLQLPGKMCNTDVKGTAILKTLVLLKHFQFVLPKYLNGYPIECMHAMLGKTACGTLGRADLSWSQLKRRKALGTLNLICLEFGSSHCDHSSTVCQRSFILLLRGFGSHWLFFRTLNI